MKKVFLINYKVDEDSIIKDRIKSLGPWMNYFPKSWLVETSLNSKEIYEKISEGYEKNRFLVIEVDPSNNWGYLPRSGWEWLDNR